MVAVQRLLTENIENPFDTIEWTHTDAQIKDDGGGFVFQQENIEVPAKWSENAINIVASKYFFGSVGDPDRENSVRQLIDRISTTIYQWGMDNSYFDTAQDASNFYSELSYILLHQMAAFNSPVYFNVGVVDNPQSSACFINSVEDSMESIMDLATREALLFKYGSGTGTNLSTLRSSKELVRAGGTASGPISFMKGYDAFANVIKSGGRTRRSAKMVLLNADHPDIEEFVWCKHAEEKKAWALIDAGYDASLNGDAYSSIFFQNANHSVRVTDDFMFKALGDEEWELKSVTTGEVLEVIKARDLLRSIADAAWHCGDPGLQMDDIIQDWHTCKTSGRIEASNPCSEYVFLNDTACNLSSVNLMSFYDYELDTFDWTAYEHVCRIMILAQEILVSNSSYPSELIAQNSEDFRPLGLGYTNLGALLMAHAVPYDSDYAREIAAVLASVMTAAAYHQSSIIAQTKGAFNGYTENIQSVQEVMIKHRDAAHLIINDYNHEQAFRNGVSPFIGGIDRGQMLWQSVVDAVHSGEGIRNSQVTVIAPTGTISFMMDCATTGIEPDIALIKYKNLSGGGYLEIVNEVVGYGLQNLHYDDDAITAICDYIQIEGTIEGAPYIAEDHYAVFDCAFKAPSGTRSISPQAHVEMLGAVQPFLSGAISKTVNMPNNATVDDIVDIYTLAWQRGVKAVAVYRDGSKRIQPLIAGVKDDDHTGVEQVNQAGPPLYHRNKLSSTRLARTHKFSLNNLEGYLTVGEYDDGSPGELFIRLSKQGSIASGLLDAVGILTSICLQSGVPIDTLVNKFAHTRFEPSGWTDNPDIKQASSILDYVYRWVATHYGNQPLDNIAVNIDSEPLTEDTTIELTGDVCFDCGGMTRQSGSCKVCTRCGSTTGCG